MTAPDDWRDMLAQGSVICRVLQDGALVEETTPVAVADLWAPIRIHETGGISRGDFAGAYRDFVESRTDAGRYTGEACETIVKFGAAIQFRQAFTVEFRRKARWSSLRDGARRFMETRLRKMRSLAALALLSSSALAEPDRPWRLWAFEPDEPGRLERCAELALHPPARRISLDVGLTVHWRGGDLVQTGRSDARRDWPAFNACFMLVVADRIVAAGAIVPRHSARLLRTPTLVLKSPADAERLDFELLPSFPADAAAAPPEAWRAALAPLSAPAK